MEWIVTGKPLSTNVTLDIVKWLREEQIVLSDWVVR